MFFTLLKPTVVILLAAASVFIAVNYSAADVRRFVDEAGIYAPMLFILICVIKPVLIFLPSMGLTIIAGVLFGPVYGTVYVALGGAGSTLVGFYFARWLGRDFIERLAKSKKFFSAVEEWMKTGGKDKILAMRLFNLPWDIVSYWAGITGVPFRDFYVSSLIVLVPMSFLYVYFGSRIFSPASPGFLISLFIIILLGAIPHIAKKYREKGRCKKKSVT